MHSSVVSYEGSCYTKRLLEDDLLKDYPSFITTTSATCSVDECHKGAILTSRFQFIIQSSFIKVYEIELRILTIKLYYSILKRINHPGS